MIGCYDFCGHYEWTFQWLEEQGGPKVVEEFWEVAIGRNSQRHARELIVSGGIEGMKRYWQHTLAEEAAGYTLATTSERARLDMHDCPSKGFLIRNDLQHFADYCDHCLGWIGPLMSEAGFTVDHEHNHRGQCWWEFHPAGEKTGGFSAKNDIRLEANWERNEEPIDVFRNAVSVRDKYSRPSKKQA